MKKNLFNYGLTVFWISLFGATLTTDAFAQLPRYYQETAKNNEGAVVTANFLFGGHLAAADLSDRFGSHLSMGLGTDYITQKDWIIGAQGSFYFGSNVNEDVISSVRNSDGLIFGANGDIATIQLRLRGIYIGGHIGKHFRLNSQKRSGIRATLGAGLYQHKVRIQDDPVVAVPQLNKSYKKGYDQLSNGFALTQFIGYQHLGAMRRANFIIGIELTQGFTQNRRSFDFETRSDINDSRFDLVVGLRAQWLLPFYLGESAEDIRY
ncbi:MAG: hypothetical protein AAFZ15_06375 [Bacteroidota bacterium]